MKSPDRMSVDELRDEVEYLRGELCLQRDLELEQELHRRWRLTQGECRILVALYSANGRVISRYTLIDLDYGSRDVPTGNVPAVLIHHIKRKTPEPWVTGLWGRGYFMNAAGLAAISAVKAAVNARGNDGREGP